MGTERTLIVSNRLPFTVESRPDGIQLVPSGGGLATGLRPWHERTGGVWFGCPGDLSEATSAQRREADAALAAHGLVPVHLSDAQRRGYYDGFANGVLWPAFHYLVDHMPGDAPGWDAYREVNALFAEAVTREYRSGDVIWIHDYHLMLVPALVRARLPRARIGFFLHIPFPASEIFRTLPWRRELLHGLLGADLLGFHTFAYMRHFLTSLLHVEGLEADIDRVRVGARDVVVDVLPMGIDAAAFGALASDPDVRAQAAAIRRDAGERRIVLGIDRLDYTKGIPHRLDAIESLFRQHPDLRDTIRYIQIAVPSRQEVGAYRQFRKQVEERVGHINGTCGSVGSAPIHYMYRSVPPKELAALYGAADVMLVTPLRDGMNLVAKEFVASRPDESGVLLLSEFAGAAAELNGALTVNPYDVDGLAETIRRGVTMAAAEKRARMRSLRAQVIHNDVHAWANRFLGQLRATAPAPVARIEPPVHVVLDHARQTRRLRILLDYDGTLVPLARTPDLASPDRDLLALLEALTRAPGIEVDVVSGRPRAAIEKWFGHLIAELWAEHGYWRCDRHDTEWTPTIPVPVEWIDRVRPILERFATATPGAFVEAKTASLAWHYRQAPREFGARQAHELRLLLGDVLSNQPLEVLEGKKVIEVRARGVSKALVAHSVAAEVRPGTQIVAIGDDRTDDELFRALPASSVTIAVGPSATARFRVDDSRAVRQLLGRLVEASDRGDQITPATLSRALSA